MSTVAVTNLKHESATGNNIILDSSGNAAFADGSASAPSITNDGDTNTGIYFPAADNIGFATNGVIRGRWTNDGLCFNADTAAANALDDYEEGTFTVTNNGDATGTFSAQAGEYTKIGNLCIVRIIFTVNNNFNQNAIGGLPFTAAGTGSPSGIGFIGSVLTASSNQSPIIGEIDVGSSSVYFFVGSNVTSSHTPNTTNSIYRLSIVYRTT